MILAITSIHESTTDNLTLNSKHSKRKYLIQIHRFTQRTKNIHTTIFVIVRCTSKIHHPPLALIFQLRLWVLSRSVVSNVDILDYFLNLTAAELICVGKASKGKCNTMRIRVSLTHEKEVSERIPPRQQRDLQSYSFVPYS